MPSANNGVVVNFSVKNSNDGEDDLDLRASLEESLCFDNEDGVQKLLLTNSTDLEKNHHMSDQLKLPNSNHNSGSS